MQRKLQILIGVHHQYCVTLKFTSARLFNCCQLSNLQPGSEQKSHVQIELASMPGFRLHLLFLFFLGVKLVCGNTQTGVSQIHITNKWLVDPRRKKKCPMRCNMSLLVKSVKNEAEATMAFVFNDLKKRDTVKWNSVWPVYAKITLAFEYTLLPIAKGSLITNQSGLEQTFALTLVLLRYSASHTLLTRTFQTWYEYQYINAWRHIQRHFVWTIKNNKPNMPKTSLLF